MELALTQERGAGADLPAGRLRADPIETILAVWPRGAQTLSSPHTAPCPPWGCGTQLIPPAWSLVALCAQKSGQVAL